MRKLLTFLNHQQILLLFVRSVWISSQDFQIISFSQRLYDKRGRGVKFSSMMEVLPIGLLLLSVIIIQGKYGKYLKALNFFVY